MRYLIISDIHANWEALEAVIEAADHDGFDRIVCCGDLVGYGADPNAVVDWFRASVPHTIRGNHDKVAVGLADLDWFNDSAQKAAIWTDQQLTQENRDYLCELPSGPRVVEGFSLVHGSPADEDEYIVTEEEALSVAHAVLTTVTFFGHTHLQGGFQYARRRAYEVHAPDAISTRRELRLDLDDFYLLNPGSVGQPRDHDPRAAWAIYEPEERLVVFRRCSYDIAAAAGKIKRAGLPLGLAARLVMGR